MPFDSTGTYTPPTGATNATPGSVIRSATWNTIFADMATALTQLGENSYLNGPHTVTSGSFTIATTDSVVLVKGSSPTITLPLSSTKVGPVRVFGDAATVFGSANAVVVTSGGDTINGASTFTLNTNYQAVGFYPLSTGGYIRY